VFTGHQSVHAGQNKLFVDTNFSSFEAEHALVWSGATFIWVLKFQWQQILQTIFREDGVPDKRMILSFIKTRAISQFTFSTIHRSQFSAFS
jgi:hypothetical protein